MSSRQTRRPASRRQFVVLAGSAAAGCAAGCSFRRPYDGAAVDLRGFNLVDPDEVDLARASDLRPAPDLSTPPPPPDLTGVDLSGADLRPPPDLYQPDLAPPPDLAPSCSGTVELEVGSLSVNQAQKVPGFELFVIRDANGLAAVSAYCTHSGCVITYNAGPLNYSCACHGSLFTFDGRVVRGPALVPLPHYAMCWVRTNQRVAINLAKKLPGTTERLK